MTPQRIPSNLEFTTDVASQEQWDCDVFELTESSGCEHWRRRSRRHANTFKLDMFVQ